MKMSVKNDIVNICEEYAQHVAGGATPGEGRSTVPTSDNPTTIAIKPEQDEIETLKHDETETESYMAKSELYKIHKAAKELYNLIKDCDNLEPWVFSKITVAASYLEGVKNYLEYDKFKKEGEFDTDTMTHTTAVTDKVRAMLQGESRDVLENVLRQAIFNLEAIEIAEKTKQ